MSKTQPARGMRDFLPADARKRNYVIGIIKEVYEKYGFEPLETPSVENLETLTGKYGEEGNQLMFKILKRGEKLQEELAGGKITSENDLSDLALRYDLTVPLARVVANYRNELPKFFKRYQIQPVWRADRPAKGRFREFYQCDVDAIGSTSMLVEAELISAVREIFERLGFNDFVVRINNRELLKALLNDSEISEDKHNEALVAIDKLDKIGSEGVFNELVQRGISEKSAKTVLIWFGILDWITDKEKLEKYLSDLDQYNELVLSKLSETPLIFEASKQINNVLSFIKNTSAKGRVKIDISLARGLSYYTGAILEINVPDFAGSLAGGGRYDGLIGMFGKEQIPAVGFSIGLERILVVMEQRGMFPENLTANSADVMITNWRDETASESLKLAGELRAEGLRVLVYPEADKLGKQFKYAASINIPFVCVLGESEIAENKVTLKNMKSGEQETFSREEVSDRLKG